MNIAVINHKELSFVDGYHKVISLRNCSFLASILQVIVITIYTRYAWHGVFHNKDTRYDVINFFTLNHSVFGIQYDMTMLDINPGANISMCLYP